MTEQSESRSDNSMAAPDDKRKSGNSEAAELEIQDRGGSRSGHDRRQIKEPYEGSEQRSGRDRRRGFDRRSGIERRRANERRLDRFFRNGELIERRDALRKRVNET